MNFPLNCISDDEGTDIESAVHAKASCLFTFWSFPSQTRDHLSRSVGSTSAGAAASGAACRRTSPRAPRPPGRTAPTPRAPPGKHLSPLPLRDHSHGLLAHCAEKTHPARVSLNKQHQSMMSHVEQHALCVFVLWSNIFFLGRSWTLDCPE